jgi:hypothetical protein
MDIKLFLSLSYLLALKSFATIHTVSNSPSTVAQFSTIQAAINAASSGDTIHVVGSPLNYAAFSLSDKKLAIIGPGFAPDKEIGQPATVDGGAISGTGSSGSIIQGIKFIQFTVGAPFPSDLQFVRNLFDATANGGPFPPNPRNFLLSGSGLCKNYLFESNAFYGYNIFSEQASLENILFRNNYFYFNTSFHDVGIIRRFTNCSNVVFDHNLFMGPSQGHSRIVFAENCRFLTLSNNIFLRMNAADNNSGSYFNNNLTYEAVNNTPWLSNGNVNGGGNIENADPQMVAQASASAGVFNLLADYSITAGPANNAGSDGKDIGLLYDETGPYNWAKARNNRLPRISKMNVINRTVSQGATITIAIEAKPSN